MEATPLIGKFMLDHKVCPDLVLSSPAKRAAQTTELVKKSAHLDCELRYDRRLYAASAAAIRDILSGEHANVVLLVGHNPGLQDLQQYLTGEPMEIPTAALARIVLEVQSWNELREQTGRLDWLVRPKSLRKR
jgi:phosphohistidine phosphatase